MANSTWRFAVTDNLTEARNGGGFEFIEDGPSDVSYTRSFLADSIADLYLVAEWQEKDSGFTETQAQVRQPSGLTVLDFGGLVNGQWEYLGPVTGLVQFSAPPSKYRYIVTNTGALPSTPFVADFQVTPGFGGG